MNAFQTRTVTRHDGQRRDDAVAVEEPLEIRVAGETVAITMRTPGDDAQLALGFLYSEGVIRGADDVGSAVHCGHPGEEGYGNVLDVTPAPGAHVVLKRLDATRRGTITTSACGVCGRQTIDDLLAAVGPVEAGPSLDASMLARAVATLGQRQPLFARTGGVHAAAMLDERGAVLASAEDVGRHNAVDNVVGHLLAGRLAPARRTAGSPAVLVVSGRASFEIVHKAAMARVPVVVSVSACSSLAADLSQRVGLTLACFCRGEAFNVMTHPQRLAGLGR